MLNNGASVSWLAIGLGCLTSHLVLGQTGVIDLHLNDPQLDRKPGRAQQNIVVRLNYRHNTAMLAEVIVSTQTVLRGHMSPVFYSVVHKHCAFVCCRRETIFLLTMRCLCSTMGSISLGLPANGFWPAMILAVGMYGCLL